LLKVKTVQGNDGEEYQLIQIRNPWGNSREWNGDWSDSSDCWEKIADHIAELFNDESPDGTFWMCYADFERIFRKVYVSPFDMQVKKGTHKSLYSGGMGMLGVAGA
jgi:hypothetical protein